MKQDNAYIACQDLFKIYKVADQEAVALRGLDLLVRQGEMLAIAGPSGSGKSTLLNILAGYDLPSAGTVTVGGRNMLKMTPGEIVEYRRDGIGFVWQQVGRNLVPYLTAQQNVELPLLLSNTSKRSRTERAKSLLGFVGLEQRAGTAAERLSGGEQQRVAIATALANNPPLVLADEPTGELDTQTSQEIIDLLRSINTTHGTTIVIVTHDLELVEQVDRVIAISDGKTSVEIRRWPAGAPRAEGRGTLELAMLDSSGRLQIPRDFLDRLRIAGHARVTLEGAQVVVRAWDR